MNVSVEVVAGEVTGVLVPLSHAAASIARQNASEMEALTVVLFLTTAAGRATGSV